jgi:transposase
MTSVATREKSNPAQALYVAFELGERKWKIALTTGAGQAPRIRQIDARNLVQFEDELRLARIRFGVAEEAPVYTCYEAGREGAWLHRALGARGLVNTVVDSSSIEVNRRARRAKSDKLDVVKLVTMLIRYQGGEQRVWRVVRVPTQAEEDQRQLHRELAVLRRDRSAVIIRVKSLLATQGVAGGSRAVLPETIDVLRIWSGERLPERLAERLKLECARVTSFDTHIRMLERRRKQELRHGRGRALSLVRKLMRLRGIGIESAWIYVMELFAWRELKNMRQVGALAGLTPSPYQSGETNHERGISKAGNRHVRGIAIEIAWGWLQHQPTSSLTQWYHRRFGHGSSALRRKGIVALARKLLVALWKYAEQDQLPEGAALKA